MANGISEAEVGLEHTGPAAYLNIIGSIISLIVFLGIVGWGAKMILRDSSGAPVVRALDGPMRISPEDPGGVMVSHQGLTVNEVASSEEKMPLEDRLRLAPRAINLQAEDQPISLLLVSEVLLKAAYPLRPSSLGTLDSEVEFPIVDVGKDSSRKTFQSTIRVSRKVNLEVLIKKEGLRAETRKMTSVGGFGPTESPRPRTRALANIVSPQFESVKITPQVIFKARPMAQLGAFSSQAIAMQAWLNLSHRHGDYLRGKKHIILKANVGGKTIYRLRVHGFSDLVAARRLCKVLNGQNAECYTVMMN